MEYYDSTYGLLPRNLNYLYYPADLQNEVFGGYDPTKFVASSLEICVELNTGSTPLHDATLRLLWNPLGNDAATAYPKTNLQVSVHDAGRGRPSEGFGRVLQ